MGMSPAMALIPYNGEVLKALKIYITALLCIFPRAFKFSHFFYSLYFIFFEKRTKNLIPSLSVLFLSFVNNGLFIS